MNEILSQYVDFKVYELLFALGNAHHRCISTRNHQGGHTRIFCAAGSHYTPASRRSADS